MSISATRSLLDRVLPKPGQGPDDRQRAAAPSGSRCGPRPPAEHATATTIGADLDPGYDGTAVMLGESAISLAADAELGPPGVTTPMAALGTTLPQRLRDRGFTVATERLDS